MEDADVGRAGIGEDGDDGGAELTGEEGAVSADNGVEVGDRTGGKRRDAEGQVGGGVVVDVEAERVGLRRDLEEFARGAEVEVDDERRRCGGVGDVPDVDLAHAVGDVDGANADVTGGRLDGGLVKTKRGKARARLVGNRRVGGVGGVVERRDREGGGAGRVCASGEDVKGVVAFRDGHVVGRSESLEARDDRASARVNVDRTGRRRAVEDADVGLASLLLPQELNRLASAEIGHNGGAVGICDREQVGRGAGGKRRHVDNDVGGGVVVEVDAERVGGRRDFNLRSGATEGEVLEEKRRVGRVGHIPDVDLRQDAGSVDGAHTDVTGTDGGGRLVETERRNRAVVVVGHEGVGRIGRVGERGDGERRITGRACAITEDVEGIVAGGDFEEARAEAVGECVHNKRVARVDVDAGLRGGVGKVRCVEDADLGVARNRRVGLARVGRARVRGAGI